MIILISQNPVITICQKKYLKAGTRICCYMYPSRKKEKKKGAATFKKEKKDTFVIRSGTFKITSDSKDTNTSNLFLVILKKKRETIKFLCVPSLTPNC